MFIVYPMVEKWSLTKRLQSDFAVLSFNKPQAPEIKNWKEFIQPILDKFIMSVTALNNYLKCPLEFYFKNLVRIPSPKNDAIEFGSAVHHALEKLFGKCLQNPWIKNQGNTSNEFPSKPEFIEDFVWYMNRHREVSQRTVQAENGIRWRDTG